MCLHCGSCKLIFWHYFIIFLRYLRTLYIFWSLVRRRVTRRLTRLQTMCNLLKYRKILSNGALRLRCGCVYFFNLLKTSTVTGSWLLVEQDSLYFYRGPFTVYYPNVKHLRSEWNTKLLGVLSWSNLFFYASKRFG